MGDVNHKWAQRTFTKEHKGIGVINKIPQSFNTEECTENATFNALFEITEKNSFHSILPALEMKIINLRDPRDPREKLQKNLAPL